MNRQEEKKLSESGQEKLFEMCVKMGMSFEQFQETKKDLEEKFGRKE